MMNEHRVKELMDELGFTWDERDGALVDEHLSRFMALQELMAGWFRFEESEGHFETAHPIDDEWLRESTEEFLVG